MTGIRRLSGQEHWLRFRSHPEQETGRFATRDRRGDLRSQMPCVAMQAGQDVDRVERLARHQSTHNHQELSRIRRWLDFRHVQTLQDLVRALTAQHQIQGLRDLMAQLLGFSLLVHVHEDPVPAGEVRLFDPVRLFGPVRSGIIPPDIDILEEDLFVTAHSVRVVLTVWMSVGFIRGVIAEPIRRVGADPSRGASQAVVVGDIPLVHTQQVFPPDSATSIDAQVDSTLNQLDALLREAGADLDQVVKLNVVAANPEVVPAVAAALSQRYAAERAPAVSYVLSRLPRPTQLVAIDAVAGLAARPSDAPPLVAVQPGSRSRTLPAGTKIYVAGQAEKGASLAEATRKTLESLQKTLQYVGRDKADIVQVKSFLSPMANMSEAERAMKDYFGEKQLPPTVWVEWQTPLIEIEVIAWGGPVARPAPIEFITPPGMTTSPVYSRVARTQAPGLIYISGLHSRQGSDAAGEVTDIFAQLSDLLGQTGSDLRHLAKATYYCSTNDTSTKLNELRPKYYDPKRPPAASKAMVIGVGHDSRALTLDMIAVPANQ